MERSRIICFEKGLLRRRFYHLFTYESGQDLQTCFFIFAYCLCLDSFRLSAIYCIDFTLMALLPLTTISIWEKEAFSSNTRSKTV